MHAATDGRDAHPNAAARRTNYIWPSSNTHLSLGWAADKMCHPYNSNSPPYSTEISIDSYALQTTVTGATMGTQTVNMSLYTHTLYRVDYALSLDPATHEPAAGQPWGYLHPSNKVVAMLWHQARDAGRVVFVALTPLPGNRGKTTTGQIQENGCSA